MEIPPRATVAAIAPVVVPGPNHQQRISGTDGRDANDDKDHRSGQSDNPGCPIAVAVAPICFGPRIDALVTPAIVVVEDYLAQRRE